MSTELSQAEKRLRDECLRTKKYSPRFYCTVWCSIHHGPGPDCAYLTEQIARLDAEEPKP